MSGDGPRRKDLVSSLSDQSRRSVIKGLAGFATFTGASTVAAGSEAPSPSKTDALFKEHARDVLEELSAAGALPHPSASSLRTDKPMKAAADDGVARVERDGTEIYAVRQRTDEGQMAMFVVPETGESFALLDTGSEIAEFGDTDVITNGCSCDDAFNCPSTCSGGEYCYGIYTGICCLDC